MLDTEGERNGLVSQELAESGAWNRHNQRRWLGHAGEGTVEFEFPRGRHRRLDLVNISPAGVCFGVDDDGLRMRRGQRIERVLVRIGDVEVTGSLVVAHVTESLMTGTVCGAEFCPSTLAEGAALFDLLLTLGSADPE